ncbi:hypothetical protein Lalb_Chr17g0339781 [Lupinus albus]|uniref:Uncharacterized protein n=1 Tax=Lupinus albus TaxID=3870 RepID=A0A6A4P1R3_LUPAL|nr:hypothetical protein Lalb_Chr17g0339781 [Lupinus albus]
MFGADWGALGLFGAALALLGADTCRFCWCLGAVVIVGVLQCAATWWCVAVCGDVVVCCGSTFGVWKFRGGE